MAVDQAVNEEDDVEAALPERKSRAGRLLLISSLILVLLVGGGVGATVLLLDEETLRELPFASTLLGDTEGETGSDKVRKNPPIYVELGEPFVVNFIQGAQVRYLQVRIEAMTRDPMIPEAIANHLPQIRHKLVFMFSAFDYASLASIEGKTEVRDRALEEIQQVLEEETGSAGVEDVYFTSFVMQ